MRKSVSKREQVKNNKHMGKLFSWQIKTILATKYYVQTTCPGKLFFEYLVWPDGMKNDAEN